MKIRGYLAIVVAACLSGACSKAPGEVEESKLKNAYAAFRGSTSARNDDEESHERLVNQLNGVNDKLRAISNRQEWDAVVKRGGGGRGAAEELMAKRISDPSYELRSTSGAFELQQRYAFLTTQVAELKGSIKRQNVAARTHLPALKLAREQYELAAPVRSAEARELLRLVEAEFQAEGYRVITERLEAESAASDSAKTRTSRTKKSRTIDK